MRIRFFFTTFREQDFVSFVLRVYPKKQLELRLSEALNAIRRPTKQQSRMKKLLFLIALVPFVALNPSAFGAFETFSVTLDPAQDGGGARTGTGSGTLTFDTVANTLTFNSITWSGLSADSTASHIHGPSGPFPASAGVLYFLSSPATHTTTGAGITSGTISGTLPLVDGTGGFTLAQQVAQLEGGQWYINIHSTAFPGGEIRGSLVPEPSSLALLGLGAGALFWRLRRKS